MARMATATWIGPTVNRNPGAMGTIAGLVLHIQQGYEAGSEAWFKNPASKASAHFLNPKSGPLQQLVDTADKAWAQAAGNTHWISVENEGFVPDALTGNQVENAAGLLAWLHMTDNVPLQSTDDPAGRGLGWHGMGGTAWGGHPDCPGNAIKSQRSVIIIRAQAILGIHPPTYQPFPGSGFFVTGHTSPVIGRMHARLIDEGCNEYLTHTNLNTWGSGDIDSYAKWQRKCGYSGIDANGIPGKASWDKLKVPYVG
jgi:hypothetical protein